MICTNFHIQYEFCDCSSIPIMLQLEIRVDTTKNATLHSSQVCPVETTCFPFQFRDLPQSFRDVFQVLSNTENYSACGFFSNLKTCQKYCLVGRCLKKEIQTLVSYNVSIKQLTPHNFVD